MISSSSSSEVLIVNLELVEISRRMVAGIILYQGVRSISSNSSNRDSLRELNQVSFRVDLFVLGTEKLRKSMKLGSPKYGGSGIQIELNPRTTTHSAGGAGGLFNGIATTATNGAGYHSHHHPNSFSNGGGFTGGQFVSPTHHQTNSLHQIQHQHYPSLGSGYGSNFQ